MNKKLKKKVKMNLLKYEGSMEGRSSIGVGGTRTTLISLGRGKVKILR